MKTTGHEFEAFSNAILVTNSAANVAPSRSLDRHLRGAGRKFSPRALPFLTANGEKEVKRRRELLIGIAILRARGLSKTQSRKKMGVSAATLFRWERRLAPLTAYCGRRSALEILKVSGRLLSRIQRLQLRGMSNAAAWRYYCGFADCPKLLARFKNAKSIPPSLLKATRLVKATVLIGRDFALIQSSRKTQRSFAA
jgi:hypothetical protein